MINVKTHAYMRDTDNLWLRVSSMALYSQHCIYYVFQNYSMILLSLPASTEGASRVYMRLGLHYLYMLVWVNCYTFDVNMLSDTAEKV